MHTHMVAFEFLYEYRVCWCLHGVCDVYIPHYHLPFPLFLPLLSYQSLQCQRVECQRPPCSVPVVMWM